MCILPSVRSSQASVCAYHAQNSGPTPTATPIPSADPIICVVREAPELKNAFALNVSDSFTARIYSAVPFFPFRALISVSHNQVSRNTHQLFHANISPLVLTRGQMLSTLSPSNESSTCLPQWNRRAALPIFLSALVHQPGGRNGLRPCLAYSNFYRATSCTTTVRITQSCQSLW